MNEDAKLNERDKIEWFDVCRKIKPNLTWEEYEVMWADFQVDKARHECAKTLQ